MTFITEFASLTDQFKPKILLNIVSGKLSTALTGRSM